MTIFFFYKYLPFDRILENSRQIILVVFLANITPAASTVTQMAQVFGNDAKYASAINVVTTLMSLVTMPIMVMLYQL